jgi:hypothetical protein
MAGSLRYGIDDEVFETFAEPVNEAECERDLRLVIPSAGGQSAGEKTAVY